MITRLFRAAWSCAASRLRSLSARSWISPIAAISAMACAISISVAVNGSSLVRNRFRAPITSVRTRSGTAHMTWKPAPEVSLIEPHPPFNHVLGNLVHRAPARECRGAQPGQRVGHGVIQLRGDHPGRPMDRTPETTKSATGSACFTVSMSYLNGEVMLARTVHGRYARVGDEAAALIREALTASGDIIPRDGVLHIRLDPLTAPRRTRALAALCDQLNQTCTAYPLDHAHGAVLGQVEEVAAKTNEIPMFPVLLERLDITGAVITADAMHAQLAALPWRQVPVAHQSRQRGHSRDERRTLKVTAVAAGLASPTQPRPSRSCAGDGSAGRTKWSRETVYAITSLTATQASLAELAAIIRGPPDERGSPALGP